MLHSSRTFRIFVSSTFSDMKAERNALQERVFPELQKLCEAKGCRFQAVDLRWGVSTEAALDQQTMNICLTELHRCQEVSPRPNFLILLGDRYGWIPLPSQIEATELDEIIDQTTEADRQSLTDWYLLDTNAVPLEYVLRPRRAEVSEEADDKAWGLTEQRIRSILLAAIDRLGWLADDKRRFKYECSATHQEIIEGALKLPDERDHVFAFLRNIQNVEDLPSDTTYTDGGLDRVWALKQTIRETQGVTSFDYDLAWRDGQLDAYDTYLERFATDALAALQRIIVEEFRQIEEVDDLTRETIAHEEFGAERRRHFTGRQAILEDIAAYLRDDRNTPLVVYGPSGSGKSALMAQAAAQAAEAHKSVFIIQRYIGATPTSTNIHTLLDNLIRETTLAYHGDSAAIPDEYKKLREEFPGRLALATAEQPLLIFLDGLDQLVSSDNAHMLDWLPKALPPNVKVVISVLEREDAAGECLRAARAKLGPSALVPLGLMTPDEGAAVLGAWLADTHRALTSAQQALVLGGFRVSSQPLYLKLAFEEARRWRSYDQPPGIPSDVPGMVNAMLLRLQDLRQHGEVLVTTFLSLLAAARHGLSENEILELLSEDTAVMADLKARSARSPEVSGIPAVVWLRLYHDLAPYLQERSADNTVVLDFYHRQVGETIRRDYERLSSHARLAQYFHHKADPAGDATWAGRNMHALAELPYQQTYGEMWNELESTLTDLYFIEAKCHAGLTYDLVADYSNAEWAWPGQEETRQEEADRQEQMRVYVQRLIAHARNPAVNSLPDPPPLVKICKVDPADNSAYEWTPLERVRTWGHLVGMYPRRLAEGKESVFQIAWSTESAAIHAGASLPERAGRSHGFC